MLQWYCVYTMEDKGGKCCLGNNSTKYDNCAEEVNLKMKNE